jgi:anti-sigma factor RsiW
MICEDVRQRLLEFQRSRLAPAQAADVRDHLACCAACARAAEAERALTEVLEGALPQYPASIALKRRLAEAWPADRPGGLRGRHPWRPWLAPAFGVLALLALVAPAAYLWTGGERSDTASMVREAANDYVRLLSSQHPLEVESGGIHQVKPWFEGRLDFAPVVGFEGDQDFPLKGGAVGYFLDRKAAVFVYGRRLHTVSLFVFRADGLPWARRGLEPVGNGQAYVTDTKGFNVILWRSGELGYALVSDLDMQEMRELASKIAR